MWEMALLVVPLIKWMWKQPGKRKYLTVVKQ